MANDSAHVLVIDDDRSIQRLLADALHQHGFAVTIERDGEWALKTFEMKDFDVVLLDLLLPAINGYEVARKIRELPKGKRTPIVMMSGVYKNQLHQREAVERYGAFAFVEKPFKLATLFAVLREALGDRYPEAPPLDPSAGTATEPSSIENLADGQAQAESSWVENTARSSGASVRSIRGDLRSKAFPEVLAEVHRWRGTGALLLRRDKVKKIVYFREGRPQFIKSNLLSECLGRVMLRERMISEAECEESLKRMKASGRQQGTVLIEMGCISPHNLSYALNLQLRLKLFDVFAWKEGDYQFDKRAQLPSETVNLEMSTAAVIYEGIRRGYDAHRLGQALGRVDDLFVHPASDPLYALQDVGLGEEEQAILQAADGRQTVQGLRDLDLLPPLETDRLLLAMRCAEVIELKPFSAMEPISTFHSAVTAPQPKPPPLPPQSLSRPPGLKPKAPTVPWSRGDSLPGVPIAEAPEARTDRVLVHAASQVLPELSTSTGPHELDESVLRERLAARAAAMRKMDYFEILAIPTSASEEQIAQAYLAAARENHPDRVTGSASAEVRKLANQIYDLITLAHNTLSDSEEHGRYIDELSAGVKREVGEDVGRILAAESKFQRGQELLKQGQIATAHQLFSDAVALCDDEGEFHAYHAWTRYQLDPQTPELVAAALSELDQAIALNPRSDKGYLFAGQIYKAIGKSSQAEKQFEKAIEANPGCVEALQELSILNWAARLGGNKKR